MDSHELFVLNKFKIISKIVKPNSKILDVGCYEAKIKNFLKNPDYFGVDADKELVERLRDKKINVEAADLNKEKIPFENEKFDYIFLFDILEHLINPKDILNKIKPRLNENSRVLVTLPNDYHILNKLRFIFNKNLTKDPFAPYGHLHYFPIKTGENFLKSSGFKISKKIILPPVKPMILPQSLKNLLAKLFPQSFARDILYILKL